MSTSGLITGTPTNAGANTAVVTVTDPSANAVSTKVFWLITGSSGCTPGTFGKNRGFESGSASWSATANVIGQAAGASDPAHAGTWRAKLGGYNAVHTDTLSQSIPIPSVNCGSVKIRFSAFVNSNETTAVNQNDTLTTKLGATVAGTMSNLDDVGGYVETVYTVTPTWNSNQTLLFTSVENSTLMTRFLTDDISVEIP